ncbi:MAG: hypothetical protein SFU85_11485 [Candidatus Methylacidiphilales bacterium]|nr:hypothetical protein [Candidatus Methylacidiphilales bacterium]
MIEFYKLIQRQSQTERNQYMKKNMIQMVFLVAALTATLGAEEQTKIDPAIVDKEVGLYPLKVCIVSGEKLGDHGQPFVLKHEGREVQFCCKECVKDFKADPAKHLKHLDAAVEAQQKPGYSLKDCPVSLEKLGDHGEPVPVVLGNNTLAMLCCKECIKEALKEGLKIEKRILEARKKP